MDQDNERHEQHESGGDAVPASRSKDAWLEARRGVQQPSVWYELEDEEELDWRRHLEGIWRRKWLVAGLTVLGIATGVFLSQRAAQVYETTAAVWLGPAEEQSGPIRPTEVFQGRGWADLMVSQAVLKPV
ncbi:MAG: Wzz/FepE/Etk N-terminal domain-containing protein, partial [Halobacteriales archaeon]|nr:Wzz/FepE/Etk N-terminal domain-containing protein [Halobacteriales archaeon]